jgi:hypothetical protein
LETAAEEAPLAFFTTGSLCSRTCLIFYTYQPWLELRLHNLLMPRSHRQLLRILDLSGEFLLAVLWFDVSGSSISDETTIDWREVEECPPEDFLTTIFVSIVFAFVVKVILFLPVIALQTLHSRAFVALHDGEGSEEAERRGRSQLRWWVFKDVLLWIIALSFAGFCSIMVLTFWTNVSWDVQQSFAFVCLTYILQWYLLEPGERAFMCAAIGTFLWWAKPDFVREEIAKSQSAFTRWLVEEGLIDAAEVRKSRTDAIVSQANTECNDFVLDIKSLSMEIALEKAASRQCSADCVEVASEIHSELEQGHIATVRSSSSPRPKNAFKRCTNELIRTNRFGTVTCRNPSDSTTNTCLHIDNAFTI